MNDKEMIEQIKSYIEKYNDDPKRLNAIYDTILNNRPDLINFFNNSEEYNNWVKTNVVMDTNMKEKIKIK